MNQLDEQFNKIVTDSEANSNILGLILVGSRGKGFENQHSDYDAILIVSDGGVEQIKKQYENDKNPEIDLSIYTLNEFINYAAWDSPEAWDRYSFTHTKILVDKTGELQKVLDDKGYIPEAKRKEFIETWIDGYINGVFRSVKCIRSDMTPKI